MLLYATLHLAGVKQLDAKGAKTGKLAVPLEEIQRFRQLDSLCPGHPEYRWTTGVETTTGPARTRRRERGRHGDRVALAGGALQQAGLRSRHAPRVRAVQRRRSDGRRRERSGVDRGAPRAFEPVLDLRQQQDHDRR
jgi:hypothetical protein